MSRRIGADRKVEEIVETVKKSEVATVRTLITRADQMLAEDNALSQVAAEKCIYLASLMLRNMDEYSKKLFKVV